MLNIFSAKYAEKNASRINQGSYFSLHVTLILT